MKNSPMWVIAAEPPARIFSSKAIMLGYAWWSDAQFSQAGAVSGQKPDRGSTVILPDAPRTQCPFSIATIALPEAAGKTDPR